MTYQYQQDLTSISSLVLSCLTARSFGTSAISGKWDHHWLFWVGPAVGSILATGTYSLVFWYAGQIDEKVGGAIGEGGGTRLGGSRNP